MGKQINQADFEDYLAKQNDFDIELFVFGKVRQHGMTALHGGSYHDPVSGKSRQFDVRAYMLALPHCGTRARVAGSTYALTAP